MNLRRSKGFWAAVAVVFCILLGRISGAENLRQLSGVEAVAVTLATKEFTKLHPKADLKHFTIELKQSEDELAVIFVPDQPKNMKPAEAGTGGENMFGPEMHFFVSLKQLKIVRFHYAR